MKIGHADSPEKPARGIGEEDRVEVVDVGGRFHCWSDGDRWSKDNGFRYAGIQDTV